MNLVRLAIHPIVRPAATIPQRTSTGGEKNIKFFFPATMEQNIARVNLFRKPSVSSHLMAIAVLVTISSIHLL